VENAQTTDVFGGRVEEWSPSDYALRGRFCPISQIEGDLDKARERVGARGALLLAADDRVVLGTLCMCVPDQDPNLSRLAELLRGGQRLRTGTWARKLLGRRRASLPELIRTTIPARNRERVRFPETAEDLIRVLAEIARRNEMVELGEWLEAVRGRWLPAGVPLAARRARVSTAVLFLEPKGETEKGDIDKVEKVVAERDIIRLTECVNATVQADVRRDDLIMRLLDGKLSPSLTEGEVDFSEFASDLLELAALGSDSEAGACYLIDPGTQEMTLEASYLPQHLAAKWRFANNLPASGLSVATICAQEGQAIQLPPGLHSPSGLLPTCTRADGTPEPTLELATPMPGPLGSPSAPAIGAMALVKLGAGHEPFGAYEVALSRNGALRLALISATTKAERAARTFTSLSRDATHLRRDSLATDMMLRAQRQTSEREEGINKTLPDDLEVVLPVIQNVLSTLAEVTQSETVTFRAALPDPDAAEPHGVTLARVAAFPPSLGKDEQHAVQADDGEGINWKVACEGSLVYESDVLAKMEAEARAREADGDAEPEPAPSRRYVEHHRNTRSELCVPVFVEDRVVGVVNLESPVVHAYDAQIDIAQALAEHVGTAIANARLVLAGVLQSQARDILRKSHDLSHAHEDLRKIARRSPHPIAGDVEYQADRIQHEAEGLLTFSVDPHEDWVRDGGSTFPDLLDAACKKVSLVFNRVVGREGEWAVYPTDDADLIVNALVDILDNARRNRDPKVPYINLTLQQCEWGGQTQDVLEVRIRTPNRLRASRAVNVYRCPLSNIEVIHDDFGEPVKLIDHPQLGAYLAGTHARRAGGEVHLTYLNEREARVVFSVPSPKGG
jgi:hypothetical protein